MTTTTTTANWIQLDSKKDFSRLLYANPVCFVYVDNNTHPSRPPANDDKRRMRQNDVVSHVGGSLSFQKMQGGCGSMPAGRQDDATTTSAQARTTATIERTASDQKKKNNNNNESSSQWRLPVASFCESPSSSEKPRTFVAELTERDNQEESRSSPDVLKEALLQRGEEVVTRAVTPLQHRNVQVVSWLTATNNDGTFVFSLNHRRYTASMLLLGTPQNQPAENESSLDHNLQSEQQQRFFTLSIPVQGMEQLVLNVGSSSGRFGSKFPVDYSSQNGNQHHSVDPKKVTNDNESLSTTKQQENPLPKLDNAPIVPPLPTEVGATTSTGTSNPERGGASTATRNRPSKQQQQQRRHRQPQPRFPTGIPGLGVVWLESGLGDQYSFAGIEGCVAHLYCRILQFIPHPPPASHPAATNGENGNDINPGKGMCTPPRDNTNQQQQHQQHQQQTQQHSIIFGQVEAAHVHRNYWDTKKKLFRPFKPNVPPYLTFFGSQTFGYVHSEPFPNTMSPRTLGCAHGEEEEHADQGT